MVGLSWLSSAAIAQQSGDDTRSNRILEFPNLGPIPGSPEPSLGPGPGSLDAEMATGTPNVIGGRRRSSVLPRGIRGRRAGPGAVGPASFELPERLPKPSEAQALPVPTTSLDLTIADDEGSPTGLTLDDAIEKMMAANLDIRALRQELPQADADILTAGLRTNPLVYVDTQFIPYGSFNPQSAGGPTQYDVNITLPIDVSQKRKSRIVVARMARSALEAQFQDVVRRQIDAVYRAFVGLQSARLSLLAAQRSVDQYEKLLAESRRHPPANARAAEDAIDHQTLSLEQARLAIIDATENFEDAQESLGVLLNVPPEATNKLEPRGGLKDLAEAAPPVEDLVRLALRCRPDVEAIKRGVSRARAEASLQRANAFDDVYLFYDPITIQDGSPFRQRTSSSWAVGITYSMPIFNRNQGNIARAESNIRQTRNELSAIERRVESEVRQAEREYRTSRKALERIETSLVPMAAASLDRNTARFNRGEMEADDFQNHVEDTAQIAQNHREALVRHRRSMLDLNTAVGFRLLP